MMARLAGNRCARARARVLYALSILVVLKPPGDIDTFPRERSVCEMNVSVERYIHDRAGKGGKGRT